MATETKSTTEQWLIADSSGLVSLINTTDSNHQAAVSAAQKLLTRSVLIVIPSDIFTETINLLGKKLGRGIALQAIHELTHSEAFAITEVRSEIRASAAEKFARQPLEVSFADCLVMAVADFYTLTEIFGFDRAFKDNGYQTIVKLPQEKAA